MAKNKAISSSPAFTMHIMNEACPVYIGHDFAFEPQFLPALIKGHQVLIVTNETVAALYLKPLQNVLASFAVDTLILNDNEHEKNLQTIERIYECLVNRKHHKDTTLIALGGGVVGDITGFAASTYMRGVNFIQLPTTLLAQIDASIGGKTGVNFGETKNLIGQFYQPQCVIIDTLFLATLPPEVFRSGLAEMIKYGLLSGGDFWDRLVFYLSNPSEHPELLTQLCEDCAKIKATYIQNDPLEKKGIRYFLNLGHNIGHALEQLGHFQRWSHGEAVAIGLYCEVMLSYHQNRLRADWVERFKALLIGAKLPHQIPKDITLEALEKALKRDKKITQKTLPYILLNGPGQCILSDEVREKDLEKMYYAVVEGEKG